MCGPKTARIFFLSVVGHGPGLEAVCRANRVQTPFLSCHFCDPQAAQVVYSGRGMDVSKASSSTASGDIPRWRNLRMLNASCRFAKRVPEASRIN